MYDRELALRNLTISQQLEIINFITRNVLWLNATPISSLKYVGPEYDGGYYVLDLFSKPLLISGGAGKNIDFELFFADRGSEVHLFDGSNVKERHNFKSIRFHDSFLGNSRLNKGYQDLSEFLTKNINPVEIKEKGLYLKLDIEGAEYIVLEQILSLLDNFDQIIIEFHEFYRITNEEFRKSLAKVLTVLQESFLSLSFTSNNWDRFFHIGDLFMPNTFEVTLIHKRHSSMVKDIPTSDLLRQQNNPRKLPIPSRIFRG